MVSKELEDSEHSEHGKLQLIHLKSWAILG
jgi:hypothetical protein